MYSCNDDSPMAAFASQIVPHQADESSKVMPNNISTLDPAVADAMARAMIAREQRLATTHLADCMVRVKELEVSAGVEVTRIKEEGSTERCRIKEEHQSQRFARWSDVTSLSVKEDNQTKRVEVEMAEQTKRQAVAAHERVEGIRIKTAASSASTASFVMATVIGALGAGTLVGRRRQRKGRRSIAWYLSILAILGVSYRLWRVWSALLRDPQKALALLLTRSWSAAVHRVLGHSDQTAEAEKAASPRVKSASYEQSPSAPG